MSGNDGMATSEAPPSYEDVLAQDRLARETDPDREEETDGIQYKQLDIAFAVDCTGSMGPYIQATKQSIQDIVQQLIQQEGCDVRLALVQYRDHPPEDHSYVTKTHDFTDSSLQMRQWLDKAVASGGGDQPEAVADALNDVLTLSWRAEATKICILLCDAPPHALDCDLRDSFGNGCPRGHDPVILAAHLAQKEVVLYCVGCEPEIKLWKHFYIALANSTGGQYLPLTKAALIANIVIGGAQEEMSLQLLEEEAHKDLEAIQNDLEAQGGWTEDVLTEKLAEALNTRGVTSTQLKVRDAQNAVINQIPDDAQELMQCTDMEQMRKKFRARVYKTKGHRAHTARRSRSRSPSVRRSKGKLSRRRSRSRSRSRCHGGDHDEERFHDLDKRLRARSRSRSPDNYCVSEDKVGFEQARRLVWRTLKRKKTK